MSSQGNQFDVFKGVFTPSILTILGVILFLRLGWVVGNAGLAGTILIILISSSITFITALSISATATNTQVGPGGSYFLISRCFGKEMGAAIGLPLYLAQALGISFYCVGFAESLGLFFAGIPTSTVALVTLVVLGVVTLVSSDLALKIQYLILALILLAILSFWFGNPVQAPESLNPETLPEVGFWAAFAVFFPAVTGIEAGVSLSGDLKDPRKALPLGTVAAVLVGLVVYLVSAWRLSDLASPAVLVSNNMILSEVALVSVLVFLGLWGATLSSAMGALLGAPRTLQALAKDRIVVRQLGIGTAETNEPRYALMFSLAVACLGILAGDLNAIASVLSMFFLASYGALNLVSGFEGLVDNPSWRPSFKVPWLLSLIGAGACFWAMFMIDPGYTFIAIGLIFAVYYLTKFRDLGTNFSDIRSGITLYFARNLLYKLNKISTDARNWRPHFLIFAGAPQTRQHLIEIADDLSHQKGFLTVATILTDKNLSPEKCDQFEKTNEDFLAKAKISGISRVLAAENVFDGAKSLIDSYGIGSIQPNTIVIGDSQEPSKLTNSLAIIELAILNKRNVIIIRDSEETKQDAILGGRNIDVWWGGKGPNANLMLTLAYMLKTSKKWRKAQLNFNTLSSETDKLNIMENNLNDFIERSRIPAKSQVFSKEGRSSFEAIAHYSKEAEIVFIGLESPIDHEDYKSYYSKMITAMPELKTVVYVIKGEEINFGEIFS